MTSQDWNIDGIQFSILSGEEIKNRAILEVTETQLMENDKKKNRWSFGSKNGR